MKRFFTLLFLMFFSFSLFAQHSYAQNFTSQNKTSQNEKVDFNGQWKGGFDEDGFGIPGYDDDIKYVLELNTDGSRVSGYSYTYFHEGVNRYYTICRITGTLNRETNDLVVTEVERTKYNTPPDFQNCFQTHRLHYERDSGMEILRGTWIPAPNQGRGCGSGTTVLSRRIVDPLPIGYMPHKSKPTTKAVAKAHAKKPVHKNAIAAAPKKTKPPVIKKSTPEKKPTIQKTEEVESLVKKKDFSNSNIEKPETISPTVKGFESRRKDIIKTITITQPTFKLDFYDNGEIDGDSITVFYNGKVVLSHQRLSDKPISLTLAIDKNAPENIVTMYADNLGTIPPNTALMVVTDGTQRYEVRIESDTEKSGSVVFKAAK
jgi:hypothetical protein